MYQLAIVEDDPNIVKSFRTHFDHSEKFSVVFETNDDEHNRICDTNSASGEGSLIARVMQTCTPAIEDGREGPCETSHTSHTPTHSGR